MCLYNKSKKALVASDDIPVYKILRVNIYGLNRDKKPFFTPIFDRPVAVPSTLWCRGDVRVIEGTMKSQTVFSVDKGMIHCYPCDKQTVGDSYMLTSMTVVAYGHIPKGTPYYEEDEDLEGERNLCARKIRLERIVAQSDSLALEGYLPDVPPLSQWLALEEK